MSFTPHCIYTVPALYPEARCCKDLKTLSVVAGFQWLWSLNRLTVPLNSHNIILKGETTALLFLKPLAAPATERRHEYMGVHSYKFSSTPSTLKVFVACTMISNCQKPRTWVWVYIYIYIYIYIRYIYPSSCMWHPDSPDSEKMKDITEMVANGKPEVCTKLSLRWLCNTSGWTQFSNSQTPVLIEGWLTSCLMPCVMCCMSGIMC